MIRCRLLSASFRLSILFWISSRRFLRCRGLVSSSLARRFRGARRFFFSSRLFPVGRATRSRLIYMTLGFFGARHPPRIFPARVSVISLLLLFRFPFTRVVTLRNSRFCHWVWRSLTSIVSGRIRPNPREHRIYHFLLRSFALHFFLLRFSLRDNLDRGFRCD